jgi:hypothetical protein
MITHAAIGNIAAVITKMVVFCWSGFVKKYISLQKINTGSIMAISLESIAQAKEITLMLIIRIFMNRLYFIVRILT